MIHGDSAQKGHRTNGSLVKFESSIVGNPVCSNRYCKREKTWWWYWQNGSGATSKSWQKMAWMKKMRHRYAWWYIFWFEIWTLETVEVRESSTVRRKCRHYSRVGMCTWMASGQKSTFYVVLRNLDYSPSNKYPLYDAGLNFQIVFVCWGSIPGNRYGKLRISIA